MENTSEEIIMNGVREAIIVKMNQSIKELKKTDDKFPIGRISDGYHTFDELYEHRIRLFIALCSFYSDHQSFKSDIQYPVWRSKLHADGSTFDGWFLLSMETSNGQISYHLPDSKWGECDFAHTLEKAPYFDGHTSTDVLERLNQL